MKLPAYPLITVDPFFSIWSPCDNLYDGNTIMWYGEEKRLSGTVEIDGKNYRFMGKGSYPHIKQTGRNVDPGCTEYVFENKKIRLTVGFWTPLIVSEPDFLGSPVSYIDYSVQILDGKTHGIKIKTSLGSDVCFNKIPMQTVASAVQYKNFEMAKMGLKKQEPLSKWGDGVSAEWGYYYLAGGKAEIGSGKNRISVINEAETSSCVSFTVIAAFDDVCSIEYMGQKLRGLWHEKFENIEECIHYYFKNKSAIYKKLSSQTKQILKDAKSFGKDYQSVITAATRQILAAHKLVRNEDGELLYLSKECHSNGCINTVDVSYPSIPFFLIYNPELVKGMMTGIFEYATSVSWKHDFAPHDLGTYPIADGQAYALKGEMEKYRREIYKEYRDYHNDKYQMSVEESGNMLVMSYLYLKMSGNSSQSEKYFDTLKLWADFLVNKGIVLDSQLCTDDFAGHSEKNVNLAIKSIMGIASFGKICLALGKKDKYTSVAKKYAKEMISLSKKNGRLSFAVGDEEDTWSLKYNMVWDKLLGFEFFPDSIKKCECEKYSEELNEYGVPLDFRKKFTKTDWEMWASALDETNSLTSKFASAMVKYLSDTNEIYPFTDWHETEIPERKSFCHRTVQGGLWMPVLKAKLMLIL